MLMTSKGRAQQGKGYQNGSKQKKSLAALVIKTSYPLENIAKPTDIHTDLWKNIFYIVSEEGIIYLTDLKGKILKQSPKVRAQFKAVFALSNEIYVSDKSNCLVHIYSRVYFDLQMSVLVPFEKKYTNRGFTALTYNPIKRSFTLITKKDPLLIYELTPEALQLKNIIDGTGSPILEVSAATYFQKKIWILSGKQKKIFAVDPMRYQILSTHALPASIVDAEGLVFRRTWLYVVSSSARILYQLDAKSLF